MNLEPEKQLIYCMSHDFGSPIRRIISFAQLIQGSCQSRLTEKEQRWFEFLLNDGKLCQDMIQALLTYSRIINEEFQPKPVDLNSICQQAIQHFKQIIDERQAQITVNNLPTIIGNSEQWYIYFESLLSNSLIYQPTGKIPIIVITGKTNDRDELEITVEDNGIGVRKEQRDSLTAPLKRFQKEKDYPGIGMGLTYCMGVTQRHNATIAFEDASLGGLAVRCIIPSPCKAGDD